MTAPRPCGDFYREPIEADDDDGFPTDFAMWSRLNAGYAADRAKIATQAEADDLSPAPVVRVSPSQVAA